MGTKICCYVRPNGTVCESAALRNSDMCYWHHRDRERGRKRKNSADIQIPTLENATAVQVALEEVVRALIDDRIDPHRGKAILYGLQIAAQRHQCLQSTINGTAQTRRVGRRQARRIPQSGHEVSTCFPANVFVPRARTAARRRWFLLVA